MVNAGTEADWATESLAKHHDRSAFSCGSPPLDHYIRRQAGQDARKRLTAPFVVCEPGTTRVVGYYTLSAISIDVGELPEATARRLPGYPEMPAILLGRLAVDETCRGRGLGGWLLVDALSRACRQSDTLGAAAVVVDAQDGAAAAFYEHFGFHRFPDRPDRLFLPMTTIAKL